MCREPMYDGLIDMAVFWNMPPAYRRLTYYEGNAHMPRLEEVFNAQNYQKMYDEMIDALEHSDIYYRYELLHYRNVKIAEMRNITSLENYAYLSFEDLEGKNYHCFIEVEKRTEIRKCFEEDDRFVNIKSRPLRKDEEDYVLMSLLEVDMSEALTKKINDFISARKVR